MVQQVEITTRGQTPQVDDTDKLAVSLYAKGTAAGDTGLQLVSDSEQNLRTSIYQGANQAAVSATGLDGRDTTTFGLYGIGHPFLYNGVSWDRQRGVNSVTVLASAARTTTLQSSDITHYNAPGFLLFVNVSAVADTPSITPTIQIKDSISGQYKTVWTAAAAITATGQYVYLFVPGGAAGSYTEAVNLCVGRTWRVGVTHGDADSITYSISADMLA